MYLWDFDTGFRQIVNIHVTVGHEVKESYVEFVKSLKTAQFIFLKVGAL